MKAALKNTYEKLAHEKTMQEQTLPNPINVQLQEKEQELYDSYLQILQGVAGLARDTAQLTMQYLPDIKITWLPALQLTGHTARVNNVCILPQEELASACADGSVLIWNRLTGIVKRALYPFGQGGSNVRGLVASPRGFLAVGNSTSPTFAVGTTQNFSIVPSVPYYIDALKVLACGMLLCAAHTNETRNRGTLIVFDPIKNVVSKSFDLPVHAIACIEQLHNGWIAAGARGDCREGSLKYHNVPVVYVFNPYDPDQNFQLIGQELPITVLKNTSQGTLAVGTNDGFITVWSLLKKTMLYILGRHSKGISALDQLPNGDLVSVSYDGGIIIWDLSMGKYKYILKAQSNVWSLAIHEDGTFYTAGDGGVITHWKQEPQVPRRYAVKKKKANRAACCCIS